MFFLIYIIHDVFHAIIALSEKVMTGSGII